RLLTSDGWVDFEDDTDRLVFNLHQDVSRSKFSKDLSENISRGAVARALAGFWVAGKAPLGYRTFGPKYAKKLVFGPGAEVALVLWIFETYTSTTASAGDLAHMLNDKIGNPTGIMPRSGRWTRDTVRKILRNRAYLGWIVWNASHQGKFS